LSSLDVSKNANLTYLSCYNNKITALDVSKNLVLNYLSCYNNQLVALDITTNKVLATLDCGKNLLTSLNLKNGKNTLITSLNTRNNPTLSCILVDDVAYAVANFSSIDITSDFVITCPGAIVFTTLPDTKFEDKLIALGIDKDGKNGKVKTSSIAYVKTINLQFGEITDLTGIQAFKALEVLDCGINSLTKLDVSQNIKLTDLYCHFNLLTALDISKNTLITILQCNNNLIKSLDASKNTVLVGMNVQSNDLITLNLKNGNNSRATFYTMSSNPKLTCIQVDNVVFSNTSSTFYKDATAIYSTISCAQLGVEDHIFDKIAIYPNPAQNELHLDNIVLERATVYDALGKLVKTIIP
jgi:hypothetical protein